MCRFISKFSHSDMKVTQMSETFQSYSLQNGFKQRGCFLPNPITDYFDGSINAEEDVIYVMFAVM